MNRLMALMIIVPLMFASPFTQASKIQDAVNKTSSKYKTDHTKNNRFNLKSKQDDNRDPRYVPDRPEQKKPLKK